MALSSDPFVVWTTKVSHYAQEIMRFAGRLRSGDDVWEKIYDAQKRLNQLLANPPERT